MARDEGPARLPLAEAPLAAALRLWARDRAAAVTEAERANALREWVAENCV